MTTAMPQPAPVDTPRANPENLIGIVREASIGKLVVPEFQRSFIWPRDSIEELLGSIFESYFVGTFLVLDTPSSDPMFPYRLVEGVTEVNQAASPAQHTTVRLVLDGQQRITSLFYALYQPAIPLRQAQYPYRFYLLLEEALAGELQDAVIGVSTRDRRRMEEVRHLVQAERALPIPLLRDSSSFYRWLYQTQKAWPGVQERQQIELLYQRLERFLIPTIGLRPETGKDNIVNIFERINRTGISLSLFDLAGARLYVKGVRLRDLWKAFEKTDPAAARLVKPEFLLKVIALFVGKEPRKSNLLDVIAELPAEEFSAQWERASQAITRAVARVTHAYGAFHSHWIPYTTMLVPLATLLHELHATKAPEKAYRKVDRWYWTSVFSERYDSAVDTKSLQDLRSVLEWVRGGSAPDWIERFASQEFDFDVDEPRSAIYRGLLCLIAIRGARDFRTGQPSQLHDCVDDHIFPRGQYRKSHPVDQILNRSIISKPTNLWKSDKKPSEFVAACLAGHGGQEARLLETFSTHFVTTEAMQALQRDDFDGFVRERRRSFGEAVRTAVRAEGVADDSLLRKTVAELIAQGEGSLLEFKSSLRWDTKRNAESRDLEKAAARTIAAFLNSDGGTLLLGIDDARKVLGIEIDYPTLGARQDFDGWEQALRNPLNRYLSKSAAALVEVRFEAVGDRNVARLEIPRAARPVYFTDDRQRFFIRSGNTTQEIDGLEEQQYIRMRFPKL